MSSEQYHLEEALKQINGMETIFRSILITHDELRAIQGLNADKPIIRLVREFNSRGVSLPSILTKLKAQAEYQYCLMLKKTINDALDDEARAQSGEI
jgi:hypothetical protein